MLNTQVYNLDVRNPFNENLPVVISVIIGAFFALRVYFYARNTFVGKGATQEISIDKRLSRLGKGKVLRNVYIPFSEKSGTEIDCVYITDRGIFVIESKNYTGVIKGEADERYWTSTVLKSGILASETHSFYNPIKQNQTHILALKKQLHYAGEMYSPIDLSDRPDIRQVERLSKQNLVTVHMYEVKRACKEIYRQLPSGKFNVDELYNALLPYTKATGKTKRKHIKYVSSRNK